MSEAKVIPDYRVDGLRAELKTVRDGLAREFATSAKLASDLEDMRLRARAAERQRDNLINLLLRIFRHSVGLNCARHTHRVNDWLIGRPCQCRFTALLDPLL